MSTGFRTPLSRLRTHLAVLLTSGALASSQASPFDGYDLRGLDPASLVLLHELPVSLDAVRNLQVVLPSALAGSDPVALLLIDPDGNPATSDSFVLPIPLDGRLSPSGGTSLLALVGATEKILPVSELSLIGGLSHLLNSILGNLLGTIGGILGGGSPPSHLSLDDLADGLDGALVRAVGLDIGGTAGYLLHSVLESTGLYSWLVEEAPEETGGNGSNPGPTPRPTPRPGTVPQFWQPDIAVGPTANRAKHRGNDVYSIGNGQTLVHKAKPGRPLRTYFSLQNDGNAHDTCLLSSRNLRTTAVSRKSLWKGRNITSSLRTGRLQLQLATQSIETVAVHDTPKKSRAKKRVPPMQIYSLTLRSASAPTKFDTAECVIRTQKQRAAKAQP